MKNKKINFWPFNILENKGGTLPKEYNNPHITSDKDKFIEYEIDVNFIKKIGVIIEELKPEVFIFSFDEKYFNINDVFLIKFGEKTNTYIITSNFTENKIKFFGKEIKKEFDIESNMKYESIYHHVFLEENKNLNQLKLNKMDFSKQVEWKDYVKNNITQMIPFLEGMELPKGISISKVDKKNGSPKVGDMIATNLDLPNDVWLVNQEYFKKNYSEVFDGPTPENVEIGEGAKIEVTWQDRLRYEHNELKDKVLKLSGALKEKKVPEDQIEILTNQLNAMKNYLYILKDRIIIINEAE